MAEISGKKTKLDLPYRRIVVKLGTGLLTGGGDHLDEDVMAGLVNQVAELHHWGIEMVIVSSGAITSGKYKLGLSKKLKGIPYRQVLAAVGQNRLMYLYEQLFSRHNITVAQALLTKSDLCDRAGYLNARNTLLALLGLKVVSIVNENDVVSVDEIQETKFGDNDNLSAMVANLIDADLLLLLTDIEGLYDADPRFSHDAKLIEKVGRITPDIQRLASDTTSQTGVGGMITKIEAAKMATACGIDVIIADGREKDVILRLASGEALGTHFLPASTKMESRKRWMLSGLSVKGKLVVDWGAAQALGKQNRSLLAAGIKGVEGKFKRGDIVTIHDINGLNLGCGITNYSSVDVERIKGLHSGKIAALLGYDYGSEIVHRDNLVSVSSIE